MNTDAPINLDQLYQPPSESIQRGVLPHLLPFHIQYLAAATFFCLASGRAQGLDASPRGGPPGFVHVLDPTTIAFADWPGNNRIESLRNLSEDPRVALLFLFPGSEIFMRVNGRAHLSQEPALMDRLAEGGKKPKLAVVVAITETLFHCGKAINRGRLWDPVARPDAASLPSPGQMKAAMAGLDAAQAEQLDEHYLHSVRTDLY